MKKILTLAVALFAIVSQAASINWLVSSARNTYLWDTTGAKFTGRAYFLLASDVSDIKKNTSLATFEAAAESKALDFVDISSGNYAIVERTITSSDRLDADNTTFYGFQLLILDATNSMYLLSPIASEKASMPNEAERSVEFTSGPLGVAKTAAASTSNWQPIVPEPATGSLALVGLALLFRRKRA